MGNACTNCSACKGDMGENSEVLTVDNKVSDRVNKCLIPSMLLCLVWCKTFRREIGKYNWRLHMGIQINCCTYSSNLLLVLDVFSKTRILNNQTASMGARRCHS